MVIVGLLRGARLGRIAVAAVVALGFGLAGVPAAAETVAFRQALAAAMSEDAAVAEFYRARDYAPLWTGADDARRRAALVSALSSVDSHGLPAARYDLEGLIAAFSGLRTDGDRGRLEARATRAFLAYARDVSSGVLTPSRIDPGMVRTVVRPDPAALLDGVAGADPAAFLRTLPPQAPEYARLVRERHRLVEVIAAGGWGATVPDGRYEPGATGPAVIALRDRLIAMGYLPRRAEAGFDGAVQAAVIAFQADHGLEADGIAGPSTVAALNVGPEERLKSVLVALERERWMNFDRGARHVWVNLADFRVRIIDNGKVTFETRSVIGRNSSDRRSPEFSDEMTHLVINPSWYVPRSITTSEYLPRLQRDPTAVGHIDVLDSRGRVVDRESTDFSQFSTRSFPFSMRQRPGPGNALGKVKFMFPNPWNIYLHDTPERALFSREVRDFSHGCIRLNDPFDFAYMLLDPQSDDPEGLFHSILNTGRETRLDLAVPVPVHIVYRTAVIPARGKANYRADIYGRDARIFAALAGAGLELPEPRS